MKEFDLLDDLNTVYNKSLSSDAITRLMANYMCESVMDNDTEMLVDVGFGTVFITTKENSIVYSFTPSEQLSEKMALCVGSEPILLNDLYRRVDAVIREKFDGRQQC